MERDTVRLVERLYELVEVVAEDARERKRVRAYDLHFDSPRAWRCRTLEPDEARADHVGVLRFFRRGDERARVRERAQIVHVWQIAAVERQMHRVRSRREKQRVVVQRS